MLLPPYCYNMNHQDFDPKKDTVYYAGPYWDYTELAAIIDSVITGKWLTAGEKVHEFEKEFSSYIQQDYSVMVNSGSSANLAMIAALKKHLVWGVPCKSPYYKDEIIVSASGFPTTVAPIIQNRLKPVFVDVELDTLNFDLDKVEAAITPKTAAIFVSPVLGNPPDMDRLLEFKKKYGVELILDGCDSLGSLWNSKPLATYVIASTCSFYPAHHMCTGEGGMISTNSIEIMKLCRSIAGWGRACHCVGSKNLEPKGACGRRFSTWLGGKEVVDHKYVYSTMGYNLKPLDLQGAIGLEQLKKVGGMRERRIIAHDRILFSLCFPESLKFVEQLELSDTCWFAVPVVCATIELKQRLVQHFESNRIQTRPYFAGNILQHPAYSYLNDASKYPMANEVFDRVFFLGCHPSMSDSMLEYIQDVIRRFK